MDLFQQIDQFEKMANELADQLEEGLADDETATDDLDVAFCVAERRAGLRARLLKLAQLSER